MKEKVILLNSNPGAALRLAVAEIRREKKNMNVVIVKATIDHDADGILETLEEQKVSFTLYHIKIQSAHCKIGISGDVW